MRSINGLCLLVLLSLASSCTKDEEPYSYTSVINTVQIPMGTKYNNDFYYNLADTAIVKDSPRDNWDLAFSSTADGYAIYLNSAKLMFAYNTGTTNFDSSFTYYSYLAKADASNGKHTAIGTWGSPVASGISSTNNVYLIDRGSDVDEQPIGRKKVVFGDLQDNTYTVTFANLDGTERNVVTINKRDDQDLVYLSFDNGGEEVLPAPDKDSWDIRFVMYTYIFTTDPGGGIPFSPGDTIPYLVNGVLLNPNGVTAAQTSSIAFNDLSYDDLGAMQFSDDLDLIGWDWKSFTLQDEGYTVDTNKVFVVKDLNDSYYKLRFLDFYSDMGEKGYPTFQLQELK